MEFTSLDYFAIFGFTISLTYLGLKTIRKDKYLNKILKNYEKEKNIDLIQSNIRNINSPKRIITIKEAIKLPIFNHSVFLLIADVGVAGGVRSVFWATNERAMLYSENQSDNLKTQISDFTEVFVKSEKFCLYWITDWKKLMAKTERSSD